MSVIHSNHFCDFYWQCIDSSHLHSDFNVAPYEEIFMIVLVNSVPRHQSATDLIFFLFHITVISTNHIDTSLFYVDFNRIISAKGARTQSILWTCVSNIPVLHKYDVLENIY